MAWTIKGETGKALNATAVSLDSLRIEAATLTFASLNSDTLVWTARTDDATGTGTVVPEVGQVVELWDGSTRRFKGWATAPRIGVNSVTVTIEGPWWWMNRIALTQDAADGTSAVAERTSYHLSTGNLATSLAALIDRAIANGCPFARGTIATMYDVCAITLANMACGNALAELLRWVPDAVAWFDYAAAESATVPTLNISRRKTGLALGSMSPVTLTIGTDAVESIDLSPRLDLEVSQAALAYVTRQAVTGKPMWASQSSGTFTAGKRQMITISGPEILAYLPKESYDSIDVQTHSSLATIPVETAKAKDAGLAAIVKTYGLASGNFGSSVTTWTGSLPYPLPTTRSFPAISYKNSAGAVVPVANYYAVLTEDLPEWAALQMAGILVEVSGSWICYEVSQNGWSDRYKAEQVGANCFSGYNKTLTTLTYYAVRSVNFQCWFIPVQYAALTSIYKTSDFSYAVPPAGLAANLLAAQNWVPYEGSVTVVADAVSGTNTVGTTMNVANSLTPHATMAAMVRAVSHDLARGRTTWTLGTPTRSDFGSLVARIRRDPKDSIIIS